MREASQSAASSVQPMLSPVVPQADDPGTSPELNAAGPAVSLQAHPESPPLQVHPGDVTVVTELVESRACQTESASLVNVRAALVTLLRADGFGGIISPGPNVPNTPQESILGPSPESNSVGTAVPVQATPGSPIPQGLPGDVTVVVTDLVESASGGGTDAEQSVLVEPTPPTLIAQRRFRLTPPTSIARHRFRL